VRRALLAVALGAALAGCKGASTPGGGAAGPCGLSPTDWCTSRSDRDPCGAHPDVASCRADAKCKGQPYRGESAVACQDDGTGFAKNCPTVGCVSR